MITAWLLGFEMGFLGSIPVAGPTAILGLSYGLSGRYRGGLWLAAGAAIPEGIYACLSFWGFAKLLTRYDWLETASAVVSVALLALLGLWLLIKPAAPQTDVQGRMSEPEPPALRTFALGLSFTSLNPALIANYGVVSSALLSLDFLSGAPGQPVAFGLGVSFGVLGWYALLMNLLRRNRGRIRPGLGAKLMRVMGWILLGLAALAAVRVLSG